MPYATRADLVARYGQFDVDAAAPESGGSSPRADAHLADACAEIDRRLAAVYDLPLPAGPWPELRAIACAVAWLTLHDDEAPARVMRDAARARRRLGDIVKSVLVAEDGRPAPRRPQARATAPEPALTRDALADA